MVLLPQPLAGPHDVVDRSRWAGPHDAHEQDALPRLERVHMQDLNGLVVAEEAGGDDAFPDEQVDRHADGDAPQGHGYR